MPSALPVLSLEQQSEEAVKMASLYAARASATLDDRATETIGDLEWLASHGKPRLDI